MTREVLIEACVDSLETALQAEANGADRVELCAGIDDGGLTPPVALLDATCRRLQIPVHAMIRPRGGDFTCTPAELHEMAASIDEAKRLGARGVVLGVLTPAGEIDVPAASDLVHRARPLEVTFHRAFDHTPDLDAALEAVIRTRADRVLTSGGAATAAEGIPALTRLVARARRRIAIIAAGSIREQTVAQVVRETGVTEIHARTTGDPSLPGKFRMALQTGPEG
jgi:copper homeostasis protein